MYVCVSVGGMLHTWKSEVTVLCRPLLLSTLSFETVSVNMELELEGDGGKKHAMDSGGRCSESGNCRCL